MASNQVVGTEARLQVKNIGGIEETELELAPGVVALTGRNATNRTSLLQAIMAVLGSNDVALKGDADEGYVELEFDDGAYTRELTRAGNNIVTEGAPYLESPELADLFAFLLESNEARRAVALDENLREIIMRPVDTDAIQREIDRYGEKKRDIDDELTALEDLEKKLPNLEEEKTRLEAEIEEKKEELAEKEAEIDRADADVDETRAEKEKLEEKLDELQSTRSDLEDVRFDIETERESLESARKELDGLESDLDDLVDVASESRDELRDEIDRLRGRRKELRAEISNLQNVIQFNEEMLEDTNVEVTNALEEGGDGGSGAVTDRLVEASTTCWSCGSDVPQEQIERTLETLGNVRGEKTDRSGEVEAELEAKKQELRERESERERRQNLQNQIQSLRDEIESRQTKIESLVERREVLTDEVDTLESEVDALESADYGEILELHKDANRLEFDLGRLESQLDDVEDEIESISTRIEEREDLEERRAEIKAELEDLRTRIDQIERQAVEEFNEQMDTVLDILDYENIERIWIERTRREVRDGRGKKSKSSFDLHIVRTSASGSAYEDVVTNLSESEREVTGLVFALAGYLTHDVYRDIPFMLFDSLEAIDSERIATLIEYVKEYTEFLVVALLPEDASALDDEYQRITDI